MATSIALGCRCGEVGGLLALPSPRSVSRVICYCDDCQAFAHQLGRADLLDRYGGSDTVQVPPAALSFAQGRQWIVGLRLTPKGLYRWYARCCNSPLGNTVGPALPFIGVLAQAFDHDGQRVDDLFGKPIGAIMAKYAIGHPPSASKGFGLPLMLHVVPKVIGWRLSGMAWPHPFFERGSRAPLYPLTVLSEEQRQALRPLCGPRPAAQ